MIGRTNAGGAGGGLNFVVKAYTTEEALLAATPKENTVGVVTEAAAPKWGFSASEPYNPVDGEIWFTIGTEDEAAFNALKKNALIVYPIKCRQYVSGIWDNRIAYIYKNGAWVKFSTTELILFDSSGINTDVTGGLTSVGSAKFSVSDGVLSLKSATSGDSSSSVKITNNIDLNNYSTLHISGSFSPAATSSTDIRCTLAVIDTTSGDTLGYKFCSGTGDFTLNVSTIGECEIEFRLRGSAGKYTTASVTKWWAD